MNRRAAALGFAALAVVYVASLLWLQAGSGTSARDLAGAMPGLLGLAAIGWIARAARWQLLMRTAGHRLPWTRAGLAYVAGFAYTATPGKLGELVRVRYFGAMGVPPWRVLSAFVFERACDLLAVLALACAAVRDPALLGTAAVFGAAVVGGALAGVLHHRQGARVLRRLRRAGWRRTWAAARVVVHGLRGCRIWIRPGTLFVCGALGLLAWVTTALALPWLLGTIGHALSWSDALAIYPLAILVGAATLLPGGVGSTEATMIALLAQAGIPWREAALAALGVRVMTLWSACLLGLLALGILEARIARRPGLA